MKPTNPGVPPRVPAQERRALEAGEHREPHRLLGAHPLAGGAAVVRAFHPDASAVAALVPGRAPVPLMPDGKGGLFAGVLPDHALPAPHALRFTFPDGNTWEVDDPYRFVPSVGDLDLHLLGEGRHERPWSVLGALPRMMDGTPGIGFTVWAPNARGVSLCCEAWGFDKRVRPMRLVGSSGVFELFVPGLSEGARYQFLVRGADGAPRYKSDPWGRAHDRLPSTLSRVFVSHHEWQDAAWVSSRGRTDWTRRPLVASEVHVGSWAREQADGHRPLTYRELAPRLARHLKAFGFTHVELMPISEHPYDPSWGYQVTGYFAPTSRYGTPDDFRAFVDEMHREGLGVILDWVPGHFVKDEHGLSDFDGTALYEHAHPQRRDHPDWGTAIFDHGRTEVRNFLTANALYWLQEFHVDGLRVDAVASMLHRDYSRAEGEWQPNVHGGREDLEVVSLLQDLNETIRMRCPGCVTVAEESTAWPGVTAPPAAGGLGFTFKWNLGWMHDTLTYFTRDPPWRHEVHDRLLFAMLYEHTERFVNALSHDEVVHGKRSLLSKMPGDEWQRFANLRCLLAYQRLRPGKTLLFMGSEFAPDAEWDQAGSLHWPPATDARRAAFQRFMVDLGRLHLASPAAWRSDPDPASFAWISCDDRKNSVIAFERRSGDELLVVVLNLSLEPKPTYCLGAARPGRWRVVLDSDSVAHGGSGYRSSLSDEVIAAGPPLHDRKQSFELAIPPLAALVLVPAGA